MVLYAQAYLTNLGREEITVDLENKRHKVINEPIIHWSESVMERIALAP